ncbi:MAG: hypothetical protein L7F78_10075 [Syntrophales bacterium LBB04]|nr:hypothetical protein [Syntrophales bacterium LBB04]
MVKIARAGGIRFVGPNCMGIWSPRRESLLRSASSGGRSPSSRRAVRFGSAEVAHIKGYGEQVHRIGNQADLEAADYLEYLGEDEDTGNVFIWRASGRRKVLGGCASCRQAKTDYDL